jgi:hypothetical protein
MTAPDVHDTDADQVAEPRDTGLDDLALLFEVRRLEAQEFGNRRMAKALGMSISRVRHARIREALAVAEPFAIAEESSVRQVACNALAANRAHAVADGGGVEVIV